MPRTFTTPIVLPADPAAALQASTKQYTDAAAATGRATVSSTAPTGPIAGQEWVPAGTTRRNECPNPAAANNLTGWVSSNGPVRVTGATGLTRTTGAREPSTGLLIAPKGTVGAGETWTISCYVNPSTTMDIVPNVSFYDGADAYMTEVAGPSVNCPAGSWTRLSHTVTTPAGTARLTVYVSGVSGGVTMSQVLYERTGTLGSYFDGDFTDGTWDGTAGNSASTLATQYPPVRVWDGAAWIDCGDPRVSALSTTVAGKANTSDLAGYAPTSRLVSSGTGLTGGGDLTADRTLAVSYGTTTGTAVQGNDARLLAGYGHGGMWDWNVYGDLVSNGARDDATAAYIPQGATPRSLWLLIGLAPAGTYTGFRIFRAAAASGGTVSAALFSASTRTATTWNRLGSGNVAPTLTALGQLDTALAFTLASDAWVGVMITYTAAATTYPSYLSTVTVGTGNAAMLNPATGAPVTATSTISTAPAATLTFPLTGAVNLLQKPWASLY